MVYRVIAGSCPRCGIHLATEHSGPYRFERCPGCRGVWMEHSVAAAMLEEMGSALRPLQRSARREAALRCGTCGETMEKGELHGVLLDRCPHHGLWFDASELQRTLARAAGLEAPTDPATRRPDVSLLEEVLRGGGGED